ncbi:hypothetical protein D9M71_380150 [compost metagenome]
MGLGVGIAQVTGAAAVLVDDADGGLDNVLGHGHLIRRDLLLGRDRAVLLPGVPEASQEPTEQAKRDQPQQYFHQAPTKPQPHAGSKTERVRSIHGNCASSGVPSTFRYSSNAQRSWGCNRRPMTPLPRGPARNS